MGISINSAAQLQLVYDRDWELQELLGNANSLDTPLPVTFFTDPFAKTAQCESASLRDLAARLRSTAARRKGDLPLWKLATFGTARTEKGSLRHDDNLEQITGIEGDHDAGTMTPAEAVARLRAAGIAALVHTTVSHRPDAPRWRVLCPLAHPATKEARRHLVEHLNATLGGVLARESFTASQAFYFGAVKGQPKPEAYLIEGRQVDRIAPPRPTAVKPEPICADLAALPGNDDDDDDLWNDYIEAKRERDWDPERILSALRAIPGEERDRRTWLDMGMAVHHASGGNEAGYDLWDKWSSEHPDPKLYKPKHQKSAWKSFKNRLGGVTIRTLFHTAKAHGWNPTPAPMIIDDDLQALLGESKPATPDSLLTFLSPAECALSDPRPYIVKGLIAQGDVACVVGAPGAGKSVLVPALAYAVAQGREVHGRRTKAGRVFYVAAEDPHGMQGRVKALRETHGDAEKFALVKGVSDLLNEQVAGQGSQHFNALLKAVEEQRPSLIVIDTLSMAFPGLEENDAKGMGRVVHVARALTQWGAAVILIHHDTKDGNQGLPRGHSLLNGALDLSIHLRKQEDGTVRGRLTKNRNGACDAQLAFSIRGVEIGRDEDGDTVTAPLCVPQNAKAIHTGPKLSAQDRAALKAIQDMVDDRDEVDLKIWRKKAMEDIRITIAETHNARRVAVNRRLQALIENGVIEVVGDLIRIPDRIDWKASSDDVAANKQVNEHVHVQSVHPASNSAEVNELNKAL